MAYIIDNFDRFNSWDREHSVYITHINDCPIAIKEVEMEWGLPQIPPSTLCEDYKEIYYVYNTIDEAMDYIKLIKRLNQ